MKVVLNVPVTLEGEHYAAGEEIEVDDAVATDLRMDGKAALPFDAKAQAPGVYNARAGREGSTPPPVAPPESLNAPEPKKK